MIDIRTIKPGDRIMFHIHGSGQCYALEDGKKYDLNDGDVFVVANPPVDDHGRHVRLVCDFFQDGYFRSAPDHCCLVEYQ